MFPTKIHRFFYLLGLVVVVGSLPVSIFATSVGLFVILGNFIVEGNFYLKWRTLVNNKVLLVWLLIFLPLLVSALYSNDTRDVFRDIRLWLPLLLLPITVALSKELSKKEFVAVLLFFVASVFVATIISMFRYRQYLLGELNDIREISKYISHVRFSLMINFAVAILFYLFVRVKREKLVLKLLIALVAVWLVVFLFILRSFTGVGSLLLLLVVSLFFMVKRIKSKGLSIAFAFFVVLCFIGMSCSLVLMVKRFYSRQCVNIEDLPEYTANGNSYSHDINSGDYENGYLLNINVCIDEMRTAWNNRSMIPYDSLDMRGQKLSQTLRRYLTSLNLTKDSVGVYSLSQTEILLIERGMTSAIYRKSSLSIYPRVYELLCEIDFYQKYGQIGGGSMVQRFVYARTTLSIIADNILFGIGWGDLRPALRERYEIIGIDQKYCNMPHNQYLTVCAGAGVIGLAIFVGAFIAPLLMKKRYKHFLPFFFYLMMLVSMLFEDTLKTHIGITFTAIFCAILIWGFNFDETDSFLTDKQE